VRNDILHNPNYELSENQLNKYIKKFKEVLEIKDNHGNTPLKDEPGVEEALHLLDMVISLEIMCLMGTHFLQMFKLYQNLWEINYSFNLMYQSRT
jgi:hypothetical protein